MGLKTAEMLPWDPEFPPRVRYLAAVTYVRGRKGLNITRVLWADLGQFIQAALSSEEQFHLRDLFGN